MQVTAHLRHLRMSPRKVRLVTDLVKGMDIAEADAQLTYLRKAAVTPLRKLLASAVANAEHNAKLTRTNLFIRNFLVNQGPTTKRSRPRAFGRAAPIRKRTSHVTIILDERVPTTVTSHPSSIIHPQPMPPPIVLTERPRAARTPTTTTTSSPPTAPGASARADGRGKAEHHGERAHGFRSGGKRSFGFLRRWFPRRTGER